MDVISQFQDYAGQIEAFRVRIQEVNASFEAIEESAGLAKGQLCKLVGPKQSKSFGPATMAAVCWTLGMGFAALRVEEIEITRARLGERRRWVDMLANGKHGPVQIMRSHQSLRKAAMAGGRARARHLTPFRRKQIAKMGAEARHGRKPKPPSAP